MIKQKIKEILNTPVPLGAVVILVVLTAAVYKQAPKTIIMSAGSQLFV
jgi:hypothetical protein